MHYEVFSTDLAQTAFWSQGLSCFFKVSVLTVIGAIVLTMFGGYTRVLAMTSIVPDWAYREPIYELNFSLQTEEGTFRAFESRLPELKKLGVGIIWTQPIHPRGLVRPNPDYLKEMGGSALPIPRKHQIPAFDSPYCVRDYYAIDPRYGTKEDFKHLVDKIHGMGMYIILDFVPNHTSFDSVLTREHPEYFLRNEKGYVKQAGPWPDIAQLDWGKREVWEYMRDALLYWVREFDVDGFRIDVAGMIPVEFMKWLRPQLNEVKPVFLLAEAEGPQFFPAYDMDYDWTSTPYFWKIVHFGKPATIIDEMLHKEQETYPDQYIRMRHMTNHDTQGMGYAWASRQYIDPKFLETTPLREKFGGGDQAYAILMTTLPHSKPLIWNGQEIGKLEPSWGPINWQPSPYFEFYSQLLHLYRNNPALHQGNFTRISSSDDTKIYAFLREKGQNRVLVVLNLSDEPVSGHLLAKEIVGQYRGVFTGAKEHIAARQEIHLKPWDYRVYVAGEGSVDTSVIDLGTVDDEFPPLHLLMDEVDNLKNVTVTLDGKDVLYTGSDFPRGLSFEFWRIPRGVHSLEITAETENGAPIERWVTFTMENIHIRSLQQKQVVRDKVPVEISSAIPEEALRSVTVTLDSGGEDPQQIYSGDGLSSNLILDTLEVPDGVYQLVVRAETTEQQVFEDSVELKIDNWEQLVDHFQEPLHSGWFGTLERSKTCEESTGWDYATGDSELFWGDVNRKLRKEPTSEFLVWETPGLESYSAILFSQTTSIKETVSIAISPDGKAWQDVPYSSVIVDKSENGWVKLRLAGKLPVRSPANYFRLTLAESSLPAEAIQLGRIEFKIRALDQ